jgi:SAM-dependent methyltransferase
MSDRYSKFDYSRLVNWDERLHREWPFFEAVFADAPSKHLLDLGSGTGEHARFLASKGFDVTGVDSSPNMLEKSRASITPGENVRFLDGDIRDLGSMFDVRFGGALCVGNALPHLSGEDDLQRLAAGLRHVLRPGAPFVLQLINYDRIEIKKERALPLSFLPDLDNPGATIIFLRPMELLPDGKVIFMPTTLRQRTDSEEPIELVSTRRVEIRGWRRPQIEAAFREAGFSSTEVFGSYARAPFEPAESRDVILVAR